MSYFAKTQGGEWYQRGKSPPAVARVTDDLDQYVAGGRSQALGWDCDWGHSEVRTQVGGPAVTQSVNFASGASSTRSPWQVKKNVHPRPSKVKHVATDTAQKVGDAGEDADNPYDEDYGECPFDWAVPLKPWVKKSKEIQTDQSIKVEFPAGGPVIVINQVRVAAVAEGPDRDWQRGSGRLVIKKKKEIAVQTNSDAWKRRKRKFKSKKRQRQAG